MTESKRRRFPPPWTIEELRELFVIHDASGQPVAYVYFDDKPRRQMSPRHFLISRAPLQPPPTADVVAHIWPDDEFPVTLDGVMVVSAAVIELNLLYRRSGARRLIQGRRVGRNGTCALETQH